MRKRVKNVIIRYISFFRRVEKSPVGALSFSITLGKQGKGQKKGKKTACR